MTRNTALLTAYSLGAAAFGLFAPLLLRARLRRGKEDPARWRERQGYASHPRPAGALCWLHAASNGEAMTVLPLAESLTARGLTVLMTTGTVTSARLVAQRAGAGVVHQFAPLDAPAYVRRFLDHWRPDLALFVESELWPTMITQAEQRRVPLFLINARMSPRSFGRWSKRPKTAQAMLTRFTSCLAQSEGDAVRLGQLGAPALMIGNLKFDAPPPPAPPAELERLMAVIDGRPVWVAASTHEGEESVVAAAHLLVRRRYSGALLLLAPRHASRGAAVAAELRAAGLSVAQRSVLEEAGPETAVYLFDTTGELGLLFRAARQVFVGATLLPLGGHNPIEPAKLNAMVVHGPHFGNSEAAYAALDAAGAAVCVTDADSLAAAVLAGFDDPASVTRRALAGGQAVERLTGALARTLAVLEPFVARVLT